ncbi:MAG: hypothetical protein OEY64_10710 [Nitrospinota bacterium]|nr:hypothetical protein [Nitrospinota bacterium]
MKAFLFHVGRLLQLFGMIAVLASLITWQWWHDTGFMFRLAFSGLFFFYSGYFLVKSFGVKS